MNSVATSQKLKELPSFEAIEEAHKFIVGEEGERDEGARMGLKQILKEASIFEVERALEVLNKVGFCIPCRVGWIFFM